MLLDLFVRREDGCRVSVKGACIGSGVAISTALGWLAKLQQRGLVTRSKDQRDRRRTYVEITEDASTAIEHWLLSAFPF
jgi:DNA-binding IclR family transcriptional regulator